MVASVALFGSGLALKRVAMRGENSFLLLMYHRVIQPERVGQSVQPGMYVRPETLRTQLRFLKRHFRVTQLANVLCSGETVHPRQGHRPLCVITFDDGWRDFYEEAFPLLKEEELPATVFLPTVYIGTNRLFWTDRLAELVGRKTDLVRAAGDVGSARHEITNKLLTLRGSLESRLEHGIAILKGERGEVIEDVLAELAAKLGLTLGEGKRVFLSWDEVREMHQSHLISYGSHTLTHSILTTLKEEEILEELTGARERLVAEGVVNPEFIPFCYPNGNYTDRIAAMVKEAGYAAAVTTKRGWNETGAHPYMLKRIGIHQDISSTVSLFACRVAGIF